MSGLYAKTKKLLLDADIDLLVDTLKVVLIDEADYVVNFAVHDFLDDVPAIARVGTPQTLLTKSTTDGVFDAADPVFPLVTGDPCEAILIYKDTGVEGTSPLIALITGITVTPNGGNITVEWDNGASKIFRLV